MYKNIIFDLGGVLIDWDPRYLYREVFQQSEEMESFLRDVCDSDWNEQQDAGRPLQEATDVLIAEHPSYEAEIRLFYDQWDKMLGGAMEDNVSLLNELLVSDQHKIFALTNWSAETFPIAMERYSFLHDFEDILVSGVEKLKKPDPQIYQLALDRFKVLANETIFIDDNLRNIKAADAIGLKGIHFRTHQGLRSDLLGLGVL